MQATDYDNFVDAWSQAWDLYGKSLAPGAMELAFNALVRYDLSAITRALTAHVNDPDSGQYPPKPADIVRLIDGRKDDRAKAAWTKVEHAARRIGQYDTVVFDDPIIHAVIEEMGGWIDTCMTGENELPFKAREFEKRYQGYLLRGGVGSHAKQLTGRTDQVNHATGHIDRKEVPVMVGDADRAKLVYERGGSDGAVKFTRLGENEDIKRLTELYGEPVKKAQDGGR